MRFWRPNNVLNEGRLFSYWNELLRLTTRIINENQTKHKKVFYFTQISKAVLFWTACSAKKKPFHVKRKAWLDHLLWKFFIKKFFSLFLFFNSCWVCLAPKRENAENERDGLGTASADSKALRSLWRGKQSRHRNINDYAEHQTTTDQNGRCQI